MTMTRTYRPKKFIPANKAILKSALAIIVKYQLEGYDLTLRQLYYQFIAEDLFPDNWMDEAYNIREGLHPDTKNTHKNYKRLGGIINDGRLAGVIPWDSIVDRTRFLRGFNTVDNPQDAIRRAAREYHLDLWQDQEHRIEVWIEKDALIGAISGICGHYGIDYFSTRGSPSQSEIWSSARRLQRYVHNGQSPVILYLGDHDPTGIDITRDVRDRMAMFFAGDDVPPGELEVRRIALNMDQVEEHQPPPNPAKMTDSRAAKYVENFGPDSWELDALTPAQLNETIRSTVEEYLHHGKFDPWVETETADKELLEAAALQWDDLVDHLDMDAE